MMITLTPANGEDYASRAKAVKAFRDGRDFILNTNPAHPTLWRWNGKRLSIRDFGPHGIIKDDDVQIRYNHMADTVYLSAITICMMATERSSC